MFVGVYSYFIKKSIIPTGWAVINGGLTPKTEEPRACTRSVTTTQESGPQVLNDTFLEEWINNNDALPDEVKEFVQQKIFNKTGFWNRGDSELNHITRVEYSTVSRIIVFTLASGDIISWSVRT